MNDEFIGEYIEEEDSCGIEPAGAAFDKELFERARKYLIAKGVPGLGNHTIVPMWMAQFAAQEIAGLKKRIEELTASDLSGS